MQVSFTLTNMGKYEGKEVVQCYIRDLVASVTRPVKELKDFKMVSLKPGESREVIFTLDKSSLAFYSANNKWETEPGDFKVFVGGSSKTVLEGDFSYEQLRMDGISVGRGSMGQFILQEPIGKRAQNGRGDNDEHAEYPGSQPKYTWVPDGTRRAQPSPKIDPPIR